jgi:hypothetical protein
MFETYFHGFSYKNMLEIQKKVGYRDKRWYFFAESAAENLQTLISLCCL